MEKLNKDELFSLAIHLDVPALLKFCQTNKTFQKICTRDELWNYRLKADFPDYKKFLLDLNTDSMYFSRKFDLSKTKKSDLYLLLYSLKDIKERLILKHTLDQIYRTKTLFLQNKGLVSLPSSLGNLDKLEELDLSYNKLTTIPRSLGNLTNLKRLVLNNNFLTSLPETLGALLNLEKIYLYKNLLEKIPENLGNLKQLRELHVDHNVHIPESILKNKNLEIFNEYK